MQPMSVALERTSPAGRTRSALADSAATRRFLTGLALLFLTVFLVAPLAAVLSQAFQQGVLPYLAAIGEEDTRAAIRLTLLVAALVVPLQIVFGLAASWAIAKFEFAGKTFLIALIDLPFAVSPVVAGLVFVILLGPRGWLGPVLTAYHLRIIFAWPGIVLATLFVTFPFITRQLLPRLQQQGTAEEQAAVLLGAGGWQTFVRITLPNIRWALLSGVILCNARAMGEFGAVSVVSGHIRGLTNTMPLQVEILYN